MPKITDTYQLAYACCETILKELNRFPTIDLIRERIGVNSPNTIKKAMNDWTEAFAKQYIAQQQSSRLCPEVPSILTDAVYRLWDHTVKEADKLADAKTAILQSQLDGLQHAFEQQQSTLLATREALTQKTNQLETAQTLIAELNQAHQLTLNELLVSQKREQDLTNNLEEQAQQTNVMKEQHAERLKQEQTWMQRRITEEKELAAEKWQSRQQQLEERLAFLKSQTEQALQSQTLMQEQNQQLIKDLTQLSHQNITNNSIRSNKSFKRTRFQH